MFQQSSNVPLKWSPSGGRQRLNFETRPHAYICYLTCYFDAIFPSARLVSTLTRMYSNTHITVDDATSTVDRSMSSYCPRYWYISKIDSTSLFRLHSNFFVQFQNCCLPIITLQQPTTVTTDGHISTVNRKFPNNRQRLKLVTCYCRFVTPTMTSFSGGTVVYTPFNDTTKHNASRIIDKKLQRIAVIRPSMFEIQNQAPCILFWYMRWRIFYNDVKTKPGPVHIDCSDCAADVQSTPINIDAFMSTFDV